MIAWLVAEWRWLVTWALLTATLCVSIFYGLRVKQRAQQELGKMEQRLKQSARVQTQYQKPWAERYAEKRKEMGLDG